MHVSLEVALQLIRPKCKEAEDWCILRLDGSDATMEVYWSEPNAPYFRTSEAQNAAPGAPLRGWGGHAETNLVRDFDNVLASYGRVPDLVEIFLSRSPCNRSPQVSVNGRAYSVGCGNKILDLVRHNQAIFSWKVVYDEVFAGNRRNPDAQAQREAERTLNRLDRNPQVETLSWQQYAAR